MCFDFRLQGKTTPNSSNSSNSNANSPSISPGAPSPNPPRAQIPLHLAHVEQKRRHQHPAVDSPPLLSEPGDAGCCLEIFSPDLTQSCLFCTGSRQLGNVWFQSISRQISILNQLYLDRLVKTLPQYQVRFYIFLVVEGIKQPCRSHAIKKSGVLRLYGVGSGQ